MKSYKAIFINRHTVPYLMLTPAFLFLLSFKFYPILNTFYLSMQNYSLLDKSKQGFAGLENFRQLFFHDSVFILALSNSIVWVFFNVLFQTILGMILALLLNQEFFGRGIYRALVFSPWAVSGVLTAIMWSFMYSESIGVINDLLLKMGLITTRISFVSTPGLAMSAVIFATTWRGIPFFAISFLSSLQTIPGEVYESAKVDGAGSIKRFIYITLPLIKDAIILTTLLRTIWTLNAADVIFSLTGGGPSNATMTVPLLILTKFINSLDFGYTSAISVTMTFFLIGFSLIYLKVMKYGEGGGDTIE